MAGKRSILTLCRKWWTFRRTWTSHCTKERLTSIWTCRKAIMRAGSVRAASTKYSLSTSQFTRRNIKKAKHQAIKWTRLLNLMELRLLSRTLWLLSRKSRRWLATLTWLGKLWTMNCAFLLLPRTMPLIWQITWWACVWCSQKRPLSFQWKRLQSSRLTKDSMWHSLRSKFKC